MDKDDTAPPITIHVTPNYRPGCKHEWAYVKTRIEGGYTDETPSHCIRCGMSFTRYIFTECP